MALKDVVKDYAYKLGADLVGFGDIGRCKNAPLMMSPQGLYPNARTVIVMALHHPDACIELGGETHPQEIGPYSVQYLMNSRLDEMSYRMATFLERQGHGAIGIVSSNIWRYNEYKDLKAVFAPDVSHIYMAVVAGLAEMGFNGLALSPEYGARNRFVTVITDAEIEPDPLIPPGTVCDGCMLCRKHCPTQALSKEIDGEKRLEIGEYTYRFPNKNLWRCAWGEHFDLDLDLEIPDVVDEDILLRNVAAHGFRAGEMGQCLKFCVPKAVRESDPSYSRTPMRRYAAPSDPDLEGRDADDRLLAEMLCSGAEELIVSSVDELRPKGIDLDAVLPGARSAVTLMVRVPAESDNKEFRSAARYQTDSLCYDLTRKLERLGYRSVMTARASGRDPLDAPGANPTAAIMGDEADSVCANTVVTRKVLSPERRGGWTTRAAFDASDASQDATAVLVDAARSFGADLVGVAPVSRIDELVGQLRPLFEADEVLDALDGSTRFTPWEPTVTSTHPVVKTAGDWLPGARSVLVFGLRYHKEVLKQVTQPPAEAVGPYSFETFVTHSLGSTIGYRLIKELQRMGYTGVIATDLTGTASLTATPRSDQPDLFTNRFAGLAAGLGYLTVSGHLATPQFGIRQRLIAIVTDAPLAASPMPEFTAEGNRCNTCDERCVAACPSQAITPEGIDLVCQGQKHTVRRIDRKRCDWVKRYALMGDSGNKYVGSVTDVAPPETITAEALAEALRAHDAIKKYRPVVAEPCVINCPLATGQ